MKRTKCKRWDEIIKRLGTGPARMVEVGVWRGKNAFQLLTRLPQLEIYLIDRWERPDPGDSYATSGSEISQHPQAIYDQAYHETVNSILRFGKRVHIIVGDTAGTASQFDDGSLDCVFIDGDHSYQGCKRDILSWRPKVRPGGLLCGHDYANKVGEVKRAVDEIVGQVSLGDDHTWFIRIK